MCFSGDLGAGKTISLTYVAYINYLKYLRAIMEAREQNKEITEKQVYANYWVNFPHIKVENPEDIAEARNGFMAMDELWLWLDSRSSISKRNKFIGDVLAKLRKRNLDLGYTAQHFGQVDIRLRKITNFIAIPELTPNEKICILNVYQAYSKQLVRQYRFITAPLFQLYKTDEEINRLDDVMED